MTTNRSLPVIAVLGASGLIGEALSADLRDRGHRVVPVARRFTPAQEARLGGTALAFAPVDAEEPALRAMIEETGAEIVVNCIGVLQDTPGASTEDVHLGFAARLARALGGSAQTPRLLVQLSIPGEAPGDETAFSRSKRAAEAAVAESGIAHVVLRPGFVVADAAYGGSALMRALAVLPVALPEALGTRPFSVTDIGDIGRTVAFLAETWREGRHGFAETWAETWDVMAPERSTVSEVVETLALRLGGPRRRVVLPAALMRAGCLAGDLAAYAGWRPPIRSTAFAELRRGVTGDPAAWSVATGIVPRPAQETLHAVPATIQERWFARLYLVKPLAIGTLAVFWILSGLIALTVAFDAAEAILIDHGFPPALARAATLATSLADISVGVLVAWRATCRTGLLAGIAVSLAYMAGAAILTPEMWLDPLGALVKTGPAVVLMMVALAILDDR